MVVKKVFSSAIEQGCKVKMIYQKKDQVVARIVSPRHFKGDLVVCYDHFRRAQRNYKLANVLAAELVGGGNDNY